MEFEFRERVHHPVDLVYEVMRDGMTDVVPLVPNVAYVEVLEREQRPDGRLHLVNRWQGAPTSVPRALRPFITEEVLGWKDFALWDDDRKLVEWRFQTAAFDELYQCSGVNYFEDDGAGGTVVRLTGDLVLYPERIRGVPKRMAKALAPTVESWLMKLVSPNLSEMPRAVQAYLDQRG